MKSTKLANFVLILSNISNSAKNIRIPSIAVGIFEMKFLRPSTNVFQNAIITFPLNFLILFENVVKNIFIESAAFPKEATITDPTNVENSPTLSTITPIPVTIVDIKRVKVLSFPSWLTDLPMFFITSAIFVLNLVIVLYKTLNFSLTEVASLKELKSSLILFIALGKTDGIFLIFDKISLTRIINGLVEGEPIFVDIAWAKFLIALYADIKAITKPPPTNVTIVTKLFAKILITLVTFSNIHWIFVDLTTNSVKIPKNFKLTAIALPIQPIRDVPSTFIPVIPLINWAIPVPRAFTIRKKPSNAILI